MDGGGVLNFLISPLFSYQSLPELCFLTMVPTYLADLSCKNADILVWVTISSSTTRRKPPLSAFILLLYVRDVVSPSCSHHVLWRYIITVCFPVSKQIIPTFLSVILLRLNGVDEPCPVELVQSSAIM